METLDWSEIIAGTTAEMNRLGWSTEQGREYLEETYGVRSRQLLTDNQLFEFWEYLREQPAPPACKKCHSPNVEDKLTPDKTHYALRTCLDCGHNWWLPKPDRDLHSPKRKNINLLKLIKKGFCHICLRQEAELPGRIVLEAHHIIPLEDGGSNDPSNLLEVCSDCHKDIHHNQRRYQYYRQAS